MTRFMESRTLPELAPHVLSDAKDAMQEKNAAPNLVKSDTLLQGQKSVAIEHNGAVYRLQATKLGKLILTK